jgi:hypothetical protein
MNLNEKITCVENAVLGQAINYPERYAVMFSWLKPNNFSNALNISIASAIYQAYPATSVGYIELYTRFYTEKTKQTLNHLLTVSLERLQPRTSFERACIYLLEHSVARKYLGQLDAIITTENDKVLLALLEEVRESILNADYSLDNPKSVYDVVVAAQSYLKKSDRLGDDARQSLTQFDADLKARITQAKKGLLRDSFIRNLSVLEDVNPQNHRYVKCLTEVILNLLVSKKIDEKHQLSILDLHARLT